MSNGEDLEVKVSWVMVEGEARKEDGGRPGIEGSREGEWPEVEERLKVGAPQCWTQSPHSQRPRELHRLMKEPG